MDHLLFIDNDNNKPSPNNMIRVSRGSISRLSLSPLCRRQQMKLNNMMVRCNSINNNQRCFSSYSSLWKQITTLSGLKITNPKYDDNHLMAVDVTNNAASKLVSLMKEEHNPNIVLRVSVESGGCHGFQYIMSLQNTSDITNDDIVLERNGAKVVMDEMTLDILRDSKLDYTTELIGSQFKIVDNPRATSSCGCGTSFDLDLDKAAPNAHTSS